MLGRIQIMKTRGLKRQRGPFFGHVHLPRKDQFQGGRRIPLGEVGKRDRFLCFGAGGARGPRRPGEQPVERKRGDLGQLSAQSQEGLVAALAKLSVPWVMLEGEEDSIMQEPRVFLLGMASLVHIISPSFNFYYNHYF